MFRLLPFGQLVKSAITVPGFEFSKAVTQPISYVTGFTPITSSLVLKQYYYFLWFDR